MTAPRRKAADKGDVARPKALSRGRAGGQQVAQSPRRGEVWVADLDPTRGHEQAKTRPALVISVEQYQDVGHGLVIVLPITSKHRQLVTRVPVTPPEGGLRLPSWIMTEQPRCISVERLGQQLGSVTDATMHAVSVILTRLLGL